MYAYNPKRRCFTHKGKVLTGVHNLIHKWYGLYFGQGKSAPGQKGMKGKPLTRGSKVDKDLSYWSSNGCLPSRCNPMSRSFVRAVGKWKWKAVNAQRMCGIPSASIGTQCDLVLKDSSGRHVVVEVKTCAGTKLDFEEKVLCGGPLPAPLAHVGASQLTYAAIQALLTGIMYGHAHRRGVMPQRIFVVRMNGEQVTPYDLEEWPHRAAVLRDLYKRIKTRM